MEKTEQRSITPPDELRRQWQSESPFKVISVEREDYMIDRASKWAADQELDACCEWMDTQSLHLDGSYLHADRRPRPPTLKEKALESLEKIENNVATYLDAAIIKDALQKLSNDC